MSYVIFKWPTTESRIMNLRLIKLIFNLSFEAFPALLNLLKFDTIFCIKLYAKFRSCTQNLPHLLAYNTRRHAQLMIIALSKSDNIAVQTG